MNPLLSVFRRPLVVLGITWLAAPSEAAGQTPTRLVQALQVKYQSIDSLSARFTQIFRSSDQQLEESGIVFLKKPGKMYWEYQRPKPKYFVADGKRSFFYVPADAQVMVSEFKSETASTPLLFLLGRGDLKQDFEVLFETEESAQSPDNLLLRLTPRRLQAEFSHVLLEVDPVTNLIHRLSVVEPIGNRNDYILTEIRENPKVPDDRFRFKIPAGVEVIRP